MLSSFLQLCFSSKETGKAYKVLDVIDILSLDVGRLSGQAIVFSVRNRQATKPIILMGSTEQEVKAWLTMLQKARALARIEHLKASNLNRNMIF